MSRRKKVKTSEKFHYSPEDVHYSSGWITEDFRLAEDQRIIDRNQRKEDNASALAVFWELIEETNCVSFWALLKMVYTSRPELKALLVANERIIKDALYSRANDIASGFVDMDYNEVCKHLAVTRQDNLELEDKLAELRLQLSADFQTIQQQKEKILELQTCFEQQNQLVSHLIQRNAELHDLLTYEKIID